MRTKFGKILLSFATMIAVIGSLTVAAPANAATLTADSVSVTQVSSHEALVKIPSNVSRSELPNVVRAAGIDWDNVWKVVGSYIECEYWAGVYMVRYFPASATCIAYNGSWVIVVILWR